MASVESEDEEADTEVEDMAEHDTITSLGQFLSSARSNGDSAGMSKKLFSVLSSRRKMAPPTSTSSSSISSRWAFYRETIQLVQRIKNLPLTLI